MRFLNQIGLGALLIAAQLPAAAGELAVLRNGFSISFEHKETTGRTTRLYTKTGYVDVPSTEIASYDKEEAPLPDAPVPSAVPPATTSPAVSSAPATVVPVTSNSPSPEQFQQMVNEISQRYKLDPDFVASVIKAESNFKPRAVSRKGARGLMQLMPETASKLGVADPFDPKANVEAGTAHLNDLLQRYHDDPIKALAAYNAGAHRVEQYHGVPPYRETRAYVAKIVRDFNAKKRAQMKAAAKATAPAVNKSGAKPKPQQASLPKAVKPA